MGLHGLAFDDAHEADETLHWHEFEAVTWVISGTGSFADENGNVTHVEPGCPLQAPAGWLHRTLAGTRVRVVIGTNLPGEVDQPDQQGTRGSPGGAHAQRQLSEQQSFNELTQRSNPLRTAAKSERSTCPKGRPAGRPFGTKSTTNNDQPLTRLASAPTTNQ